MYVEYQSNCSGGAYHMTDKNWKDLEAAGWKVNWYAGVDRDKRNKEDYLRNELALTATREGFMLYSAIDEWEDITGLNRIDTECTCCGQNHDFVEYDDNSKEVCSFWEMP